MNGIEFFNLHGLRNAEHYQFMTDINSSIVELSPEILGITSVYTPFADALQTEDVALKIESGSAKSKTIEGLDSTRDQIWKAIDLRISSAENSVFDDEMESGTALRRIFDLYGDPRKLPYNQGSGVFTNLVDDLSNSANSRHILIVNLTRLVPELKRINDLFISTNRDRTVEYAGRESGNVKDVRKVVDPLYQQIVNTINATFTLNTAQPAAIEFAKQHNVRINTYKATLAARSTRNKKAKGKVD